jgi:hypothetical protein
MINNAFCLAVSLFVAAAVPPAGEDGDPFWASVAPKEEARAALKVMPRTNMTFVEAELEGAKCTLLVDTGATHTTFDMAFVKRNMPGSELVPVMMMGDTNVEGAPRFMRVKSMKIGAAEFKDFGAMALDISHLPSSIGAKVDGILGMSTLARVPCLVSLSSQELVFAPGKDRRDGFDRPVMRSLHDPMSILLPVKIGERTFEVLVDSGSSMTFLSKDTLWPTVGEASDMAAVDINGRTGLKPQLGEKGVLPVCHGLEITPLVVPEPMNRIGADVLARYDMLIAGRYIFFRPGNLQL